MNTITKIEEMEKDFHNKLFFMFALFGIIYFWVGVWTARPFIFVFGLMIFFVTLLSEKLKRYMEANK